MVKNLCTTLEGQKLKKRWVEHDTGLRLNMTAFDRRLKVVLTMVTFARLLTFTPGVYTCKRVNVYNAVNVILGPSSLQNNTVKARVKKWQSNGTLRLG